MWQLFLGQLMRDIQRRQSPKLGVNAAGLALIGGLNKPEAYADRINREFNLRNYAKAWDLYDSNRAYWEKLYDGDPLTSRNHPASPPESLLPRQPGAGGHGYNLLNPAATNASAFGPFGTGGRLAPGSATSSRPLYETQSFVPPPIGSTPPDATGGPATFDERFRASLPATSAPTGAASPDDLEAFRRQWLKTFMEP